MLATTIVLTWEVRPVAAETTLSWKFKNGDKISYVIQEKQAAKMKSNREVFDLTHTLLLDTTWTVLLTDRSQAHIAVTIDRVRFRAEGKGEAKLPMPYEYDSQDKAKGGLEEVR